MLRSWGKKESGLSEAATAIFVLPLIAFMIFALVESGIYTMNRTRLSNLVQNYTRNISLEGGYANPNATILDLSKGNWIDKGKAAIGTLCTNGTLHCVSGSNTFTCMPLNPQAVQVSDLIWCEGSIKYKPVSPFSRSPYTSFGFSSIYYDSGGQYKTLKIRAYAYPTTSKNG